MTKSHPQSTQHPSKLALVAILAAATVAGILPAIFPPLFIIALVFLPILVIVTWNYPAFALLVLIAVLYGIIPGYLVPNIPIGNGKLQANDLALGCLFTIVLLRSTDKWTLIIEKMRPLSPPLLLLVFLFTLSLIFSLGYFHNPPKHILAEVRNFLYWLLIPIIIGMISKDQINYKFIINGLIFLGYVISIFLIFQHLTGIDVLGSGRVEQLVTLNKTSDVIRTTSPGIYLVIFSIYINVARWLVKKSTGIFTALICIPLIIGLLVTFGRGVWIATAICILLLAATISRTAFAKLILAGALGLPLLFGGLLVAKPESGQAILDRFFSVTQEVQTGSSAEWRYLENNYAIEHLKSSPLVGVGIGGFAHPKFHPMMDDDLLRYVHNGYLYLAVKIGVFGLLVPLLIIWRVLSWLKENENDAPNVYTSYTRKSLIAVFLVPCITSFTQPEWMVYTGVGFLALVLGLILSTSTASVQCK